MERLQKIITKPILINENLILREAFKLVYNPPYSIFVVNDDNGKLVGVLTEGDMRRHLLNGYPLDSKVRECMCRNPILMNYSDIYDQEKINKTIYKLKKRTGNSIWTQDFIPLINDKKIVIGMISCSSLEMLVERKIHQDLVCNNFQSGRVLIVGGAGYIGSVLSELLVNNGYKVRVLDKMLYCETALDHLSKEHCEITKGDTKSIDTIVEALEDVDAVVYLAEIVGDQAVHAAPKTALKTNYLALSAIAQMCSYLQINRFIYTSSCSVYGASQNREELLTEDSITNPVSLYARIKLMSENVLFSIPSKTFSPTILRLASVFGKSYRPRFDLVVNTFAAKSYFEKEIDVFGGEQYRPNVHVLDVACIIMKLLESPLENIGKKIFNVGSASNNYSIKEIAEIASNIFPNIKINFIKKTSDQRNYKIDSSMLEKEIHFTKYKTINFGFEELKQQFEEGEITDYKNSCYSNIDSVSDLYCLT